MKHINFNRLSIKNFLSVGETPVVIEFNKGLHIITGYNKDKEDRRNAVGKTTILDAINFAVFGNTVRDLKKDLIVNNITNKTCEVELNFTINDKSVINTYTIIRKIDPSELTLYKGDENITMHTMAGTNSLVSDLISCNEEVFQNCIIMSANSSTPFMAKKMVEKRKFIEGIFSLEVFSQMLLKVRENYNANKKVCDIDTGKYNEIKTALTNYTNQRQVVLNERVTKKKEKENILRENNEKILKLKQADTTSDKDVDIEGRQDKVKTYNKGIEELDNKINQSTISATTLKTEALNLTNKYNAIGTENDLCTVCLRPIDISDRAHINKEKDSIKAQIVNIGVLCREENGKLQTYKTQKETLKKQIEKINNEITTISKQLQSRKSLATAIKSLEDWNTNIETELVSLNSTATDFDELINTTTEKVTTSKTKIDELKNTLSLLDVVKYVVSEEGVKSFIIKKILELFNGRIAYYLKKMDSNCTCVFDEYFDEKFTNEKGKACSYFNFSGAERKAIDLACLFTFMDVRRLQGGVSINISIYDELLDSSVDEKGIELVLNILKERVETNKECVMVISHRKESAKFATGDIICLEKRNGITTRVEYVE